MNNFNIFINLTLCITFGAVSSSCGRFGGELGNHSAKFTTLLPQSTYPFNALTLPPLVQGQPVLIASTVQEDGTFANLNCVYQTIGLQTTDPNYAAPNTQCTLLPTYVNVNGLIITSTLSIDKGKILWIPTTSQRGTYLFTFSAYIGGRVTPSQSVIASVRPNYTSSNLLAAFDAANATIAPNSTLNRLSNPSAPFTPLDFATTWLDIVNGGPQGDLSTFNTNFLPWAGTGKASLTSLDPYRLTLSGMNDYMSLGPLLTTSHRKFAVTLWMKPTSLSTASAIVGNGGEIVNGFVLKQNSTSNKLDFIIGTAQNYSYSDIVFSDVPFAFYRLSDTSGTTATDSSAAGFNGTYSTNVLLNQPSAIPADTNPSAAFNGVDAQVSGMTPTLLGADFSVEAWIYPQSPLPANETIFSQYATASNTTLELSVTSAGKIKAVNGGSSIISSGNPINPGNWYHVVLVRSSSGTASIYVNGNITPVATGALNALSGTPTTVIGARVAPDQFFKGFIDEVALYNVALNTTQIGRHYSASNRGSTVAYPPNSILADNPLGYWRLGESSGTVALDSSGHPSAAGTIQGYVVLGQTGSSGSDLDTSALFDGATGTIQLPTSPTLPTPTQDFSIAFWMKTTTNNTTGVGATCQWYAGSGLVDGFTGSNADNYGVSLCTNQIAFGVGSSGAGGNTEKTLHSTGVIVTDGRWHHVVATRLKTSGKMSLYVDGVLVDQGIGSTQDLTATTRINIGSLQTLQNFYTGYIDEVAVFNYALAPAQVLRQFNGSAWGICQSKTSLDTTRWFHVGAVFDGNIAQLFINGQQECGIVPQSVYDPSSDFILGAASPTYTSFWSGAVSTLKVYGTTNGITPAAIPQSIKNDFDGESNAFRKTPLENIVKKSTLVGIFDPANAASGLTNYTSGCATTDLNWTDLSTALVSGTLTNFTVANCNNVAIKDGWQGTGDPTDPMRLSLDGVDDYVNIPLIPSPTEYTVLAWIRPKQISASSIFLRTDKNGSATRWTNQLRITGAGLLEHFIDDGTQKTVTGTTTLLANKWYHVAITAASNGTMNLYVNGVAEGSSQLINVIALTGDRYQLGISSGGGFGYFKGDVGQLQIYHSPLSLYEIKQNCIAQQSRFGAAVCTP